MARLDWRMSGWWASRGTFRLLKIQRDEPHLLRFIGDGNRVEMDLRGGIVEVAIYRGRVWGRSWRRSFFDGNCVTYTRVRQVCVLSFER